MPPTQTESRIASEHEKRQRKHTAHLAQKKKDRELRAEKTAKAQADARAKATEAMEREKRAQEIARKKKEVGARTVRTPGK
ncbi:MAG: hypothetical protein V3W44_00745 [Dehalococcoidales bacterium]